jgi:hypothetical protein
MALNSVVGPIESIMCTLRWGFNKIPSKTKPHFLTIVMTLWISITLLLGHFSIL